MKDFVFGTLATEELRLQHVHRLRAGVSHYHARFPRDPLPQTEVILELSVGPQHPCEQAWVYWTNDGTDPVGRSGTATNGQVIAMQPAGVEWDTVLWGYVRRFRATLPGQRSGTIVRYYLSAQCANTGEIKADQGTVYACYIADDPLPSWSQNAIIYQIFVDRFYPGKEKDWLNPEFPSGFYGGTIRGIHQKLDYLSELGVNVLWLTPIFPSPSHHGYDATDLFTIEPRLGTKQDLRDLVEAAHQRDIRIILDLVPNHVSDQHPTFQSAQSDQNSRYRNWYTFTRWPDKYASFFGVSTLPQLNLRNPETRQYMLDAAVYWLEFGVDGYRVDFAIGPVPDFWADFRNVTRRVNPECWTFGEVVEPPDSQLNFAGGLDGCLDFNLMEAFRNSFAYGELTAKSFASFLARHEAFFPEEFSRPSFLDNHDMNRFLWAASGDKQRLRLAALCQFTLSGAPIIYYGTEVGLSQVRDVRQGEMGLPEESRLPMLWGDQQDSSLLDFYQQLIRLRKTNPSLGHSKVNIIHTDDDLFVYSCGNTGLWVALNLSNHSHKIFELQLPDNPLVSTGVGDIKVENSKLSLPPLGGAIINKDL